jgi:hypothetical protein
VLQHQHAAGGGERDRAARAALADDERDARVRSARQASVERAIASAWPRSSASMPG